MSDSQSSLPAANPWLTLQIDHAFAPFRLQVQLALHAPWTVLFDPSGSGKTTILRALAGLFPPDVGSLQLQGEMLFSRAASKSCAINLSPQARRIGLVTQTPALFPHYTAAENIAFALRGFSSAERNKKIQALLQIFGAESLRDRLPHQLSGGQQQRIALARTLAAAPRLLLLDEPFSAMDRTARLEILNNLRQWVQQRAVPVLMVTHDLAEAFTASEEVVVLEDGRAVAQGRAEIVLRKARAQLLQELGVTPNAAHSPER